MLLFPLFYQSIAQTVDGEYLNPMFGLDDDKYKFIRFGSSTDYYGGFMWNNKIPDYGDGDDFTIYTYDDRDLVLQALQGNIIMFPDIQPGKVGIGTTNPVAKLQVNANPGVEAFRFDYFNTNNNLHTRAVFKGNGYWAYGLYNLDHSGEPRFTFLKARGTSLESPSAVQPQDWLGAIYWKASNNNGEYKHAAAIKAIAAGTQTDGVTPARIELQTTPVGSGQQMPTARMTIQHNGNIGIGTQDPKRLLELYSEDSVAPIRMTSNRPGGADSYLEFKNKASENPSTVVGLGLWGSMEGAFVVRLGDGTEGADEKFRINADGNVGIGTMFPGDYKLAVNGKVKVKEINVTLEGWSDFVFEEDYDLPTIEEVAEHIQKNKRLPGIPSATEVKKEGVNLGEMDALLLQKIEELTLYMIRQEKELQALRKELNSLKSYKKK